MNLDEINWNSSEEKMQTETQTLESEPGDNPENIYKKFVQSITSSLTQSGAKI